LDGLSASIRIQARVQQTDATEYVISPLLTSLFISIPQMLQKIANVLPSFFKFLFSF
uniref:Flagellar biosynthetic protein FliP n=1 Tax=Brugia timori TaxID=42155 RepID=A0A0R3QFP1_9BILA